MRPQVDVPSTWRDAIISKNSVKTETHPLSTVEISTQTGGRDDTGTQTDGQGGQAQPPTKLKASGLTDFVKK